MKYMHFKASCSYAALAAIMETKGVDTEDYQIALDIKLPWLFAREGDTYLAGPMLQGAKWFDLWLLPRGYRMMERPIARGQLCRYLRERDHVMLGIRTPYGKHAVVYTGHDGAYRFYNPTWANSGEASELRLSEGELLSSVDQTVPVGEVVPAQPKQQELTPLLRNSVLVLWENYDAIAAFAAEKHDPDAYFPVMDSLFRPLLLDGVTMLELAGEADLARGFVELQEQFMAFMRGPRVDALGKTFSLEKLHRLTGQYARLIEKQI